MRNVPFRRGGLLAALLGSVVASAPLAAQDSTQSAPAPSAPPSGQTHTVKKGDTLWDIAHQYLNDPFLWPEIYRINTDVVEDPHWIYPNEVLKLPGTTTVATTANRHRCHHGGRRSHVAHAVHVAHRGAAPVGFHGLLALGYAARCDRLPLRRVGHARIRIPPCVWARPSLHPGSITRTARAIRARSSAAPRSRVSRRARLARAC